MIDSALRALSVLILVGICHQIFAPKSTVLGDKARHILIGRLTVALGIAIASLITLRGLRYEGALTPLYILHLSAGGPFFLSLFATAFLGRRVRKTGAGKKVHQRLAYFTAFLLMATLLLGTASLLTHTQPR